MFRSCTILPLSKAILFGVFLMIPVSLLATTPAPYGSPTPGATPQPTSTPDSCIKITADAACSCKDPLEIFVDQILTTNSKPFDSECFFKEYLSGYVSVSCETRDFSAVIEGVYADGAFQCACSAENLQAQIYIGEKEIEGKAVITDLFTPGDYFETLLKKGSGILDFTVSYKYNSCNGERASVSFNGHQGIENYYGSDISIPTHFGELQASGHCTETGNFNVNGQLQCEVIPEKCAVGGFISAERMNGTTKVNGGADIQFLLFGDRSDSNAPFCSGGAKATFSNQDEKDNLQYDARVYLDLRY